MLRGDSGNHFQLYLYRNQDEVTHIPPPRPTGWAVHCEALPMRWWERVLAFFPPPTEAIRDKTDSWQRRLESCAGSENECHIYNHRDGPTQEWHRNAAVGAPP